MRHTSYLKIIFSPYLGDVEVMFHMMGNMIGRYLGNMTDNCFPPIPTPLHIFSWSHYALVDISTLAIDQPKINLIIAEIEYRDERAYWLFMGRKLSGRRDPLKAGFHMYRTRNFTALPTYRLVMHNFHQITEIEVVLPCASEVFFFQPLVFIHPIQYCSCPPAFSILQW